MPRVWKIIIVMLLVGSAGFFFFQKFGKKTPEETDLEAMKQSIIAPANVKVTDLTDEQKAKFLQQLKEAQEAVVNFNFDNLQAINGAGYYKKVLGDLDGAITALEYANIIRPKNSLSFSNLAALYHYDLKQYDKAEKNYLISISNDPGDINTTRNLYELYYLALHDNAKTEALLLKSIEANPNAPDLYALLANFYADVGNREKALENFQKVLELNPQNEPVRKEIERLKKEIDG